MTKPKPKPKAKPTPSFSPATIASPASISKPVRTTKRAQSSCPATATDPKPSLSERLARVKLDMEAGEVSVRGVTGTRTFGWGKHGEDIASQLKTILDAKGRATVNFTQIDGCAIVPIEVAFGWLVDTYGTNVFERKVTIKAETPAHEKMWQNTILNICHRRKSK